METGSYFDAQAPHSVADCPGAADRARRAVEGGEEAITCSVDLAPPEPLELAPNDGPVPLEQLAPTPIAELGGSFRRADDICEEDGGENAIGLRATTRSRQELFHLVEDLVGVNRWHVILAFELDEARSRDVLGDVTTLVKPRIVVAASVQDEGRDTKAREHAADVDLAVHEDQGLSRPGTS